MSWGTGRVLGNRDATLYLGAALVSGFGTSALMLAAGVWVKTLTGSSSLAALTGFCLWAPTLVGPILGVLADRMPRRALLIAVHAGLALLLLPLLAVGSADRVWLVFAVLLGYGVGFVLADAAEAALVPAVVPGELLGDFNGLRMSVSEGMKLVAPLAGAGLFARFGAAPVVLLDAVTFAFAALVFTLLRVRRERPVAAHAGWRRQLAEGVRHLVRQPVLRHLVGCAAAVMGLGALRGAALYAIVDDGLHRAPAFAGLIAAAQGIGSILGGLLAGPLLRRLAERAVVALGIALVAAGIALSATPWAAAVLAGGLLAGFGLPSVLIATLTAVQRETPGELTGRVVATTNTLTAVPLVVASLAGAALITVLDHRLLLALAAAAGLLVAGYCLRPPARHDDGGAHPPARDDAAAGARRPVGPDPVPVSPGSAAPGRRRSSRAPEPAGRPGNGSGPRARS